MSSRHDSSRCGRVGPSAFSAPGPKFLGLAFAAALLLAAPAAAQDGKPPQKTPAVSGEVSVELQNDWAYASDDRANQNNDLYTTIEPSVTVRLAPAWSIFAHAVIEPVRSPAKFENRAFEDHGLYLEDLYLAFAEGPFSARAGKLNPGFGVAWDRTPGVYGTDFAEDGYETSERIGLVGGYTFAAGNAGEHTVSAATFFHDTTILSESALRGRGDRRKRDGGVSNTEDFGSFLVAVDGGRIAGLSEFGYHLAYMHQARGRGDAADEKSVAIAGFSRFALGAGIAFSPLVEFVHQSDVGGAAGLDRTFLTAAGQFEWKGWNLAVGWTGRSADAAGAEDNDDSQFQVSAGYAFDFGLTIDVGWKVANVSRVETRTLGILAAYGFKF